MKIQKLNFPAFALVLGSILFSTACSTDDGPGPSENDSYLKEGYVLTSLSAGDVTSVYAGYFEEMPTGQVDLVANATAFSFFRGRAVHNGYIYCQPSDGNTGVVRYAVDKETKALVEVDQFALPNNPSKIIILDNETAIVSTFYDKQISIFNPETMEITGEVDLSQSTTIEGNDENSISSMIYNEVTDKIYAIFYTNIEATPAYYDGTKVYVEVIDAETLQWEKTIEHDDAMYPVFRGETNTIIDESGNTYLLAQGSWGLDNNFGPQAPVASKPQILKINTNSEFDESYAFNPIDAFGFENNYFQLFTSMVYGGNNKAYGIGTAQTDDPQILGLLQKFATEGLTEEEFATLSYLVLYSESFNLMEVDLITKEVSAVTGAPMSAGFSYPFMYNYNGTIYAQITTSAGIGFYEINPSSNTASEQFTLSTGGFAYQVINLEESLDD